MTGSGGKPLPLISTGSAAFYATVPAPQWASGELGRCARCETVFRAASAFVSPIDGAQFCSWPCMKAADRNLRAQQPKPVCALEGCGNPLPPPKRRDAERKYCCHSHAKLAWQRKRRGQQPAATADDQHVLASPLPNLPGAICAHPPGWADPSWWQGGGEVTRDQREAARHMCAACPVVARCRAWVLAPGDHGDQPGILAGLTRRQRRRMRAGQPEPSRRHATAARIRELLITDPRRSNIEVARLAGTSNARSVPGIRADLEKAGVIGHRQRLAAVSQAAAVPRLAAPPGAERSTAEPAAPSAEVA